MRYSKLSETAFAGIRNKPVTRDSMKEVLSLFLSHS